MASADAAAQGRAPARILFLNWRDCANPEGGGSEVYVETIARSLSAAGHDVTILSSRFPGGAERELVGGVRMVRAGSKLSVYPRALQLLRRGALGRPDVVVNVQNGVPFASPLVAAIPTVVLVHHVHREQWPVVYGPVRSRIGWWLESSVGPRVYRGCQYVAVSRSTRDELAALGVDAERIAVVRNGIEERATSEGARSRTPRVVVLGRLVPHKQVEHVLHAAAALRHSIPGLRVSVVGDGWWRSEVVALADELGVSECVEFHGFVDDDTKQRELARAWVLALPSLKEGWGLAITEAAAHGVPSVAYRSAGGVTESINDGASGVLVDGGVDEFTAALGSVLRDPGQLALLSAGARHRASGLSWQSTADGFADVLGAVMGRDIPAGHVTGEATLQASRPMVVRSRR